MPSLKTLCRNIREENSVYGAPYNANFPDSIGYMVTLKYKHRQMTVPFYMGPALEREPSAEDVIECLLSDASVLDYGRVDDREAFKSWAEDLGWEPTIEHLETWELCHKNTKKLKKFLKDEYDKFMESDR